MKPETPIKISTKIQDTNKFQIPNIKTPVTTQECYRRVSNFGLFGI